MFPEAQILGNNAGAKKVGVTETNEYGKEWLER
jgi:hypothetical protein